MKIVIAQPKDLYRSNAKSNCTGKKTKPQTGKNHTSQNMTLYKLIQIH